MIDPPVARLGLALDDDPLFADLIDAVRAAARDLGIEPVDVREAADEAGVDRTLVIGRPARHVPLLAGPAGVPRIVWSGEPLAVGRSVDAASRRTGRTGAGVAVSAAPHRDVGRAGRWLRRVPLAGPPARWRESMLARRLVRTNLSELAWAASVGAELVVTSHDRAAVLASHGLVAAVVPFGYHAALAGPLTRPDVGIRPMPIVTLGAPSTHLRRGHLLARMADDAGGPAVTALSGVWGPARAAALRDARVLVDVHRVPGTFVGIRLVLAIAAGVAVVTEPMPDPRPFEAGVTHLEAPAERLLETARALVADEARRRGIVAAGQALLADRLRLTDSLRAVLAPPPPSPPAGTSAPPR